MSRVPPLFTALVDDAALFPPGCASMPDALAAHPHHKRSAYAELIGRFLCPTSRLGELIEVLPEDREISLGLIVDDGLDRLAEAMQSGRADPRLDIEAVEVRPPDASDLVTAVGQALDVLPPLLSFVELPRTPGWTGGLDAVAAAGRGAKLRTGGGTATAFPSVAEVAAFVLACVERDVPFKCTAGLHHAVRHRDADSGLLHHGFLNVALATHAAVLGEGAEQVTALVGEQDADQLLATYQQVSEHDARRTRAAFVGFGSCSVLDPVRDLESLGLL